MLRMETKASQPIHFKRLPNAYGCIFLDLGSKSELNKQGERGKGTKNPNTERRGREEAQSTYKPIKLALASFSKVANLALPLHWFLSLSVHPKLKEGPVLS